MRLINLILIIIKKLLKIQENQKPKNCLNPKNFLNSKNPLSQEKSCQKIRIYLILILKKINKIF